MDKNIAPIRLVGYARVSRAGQTLEAQLDQLGEQSCAPIFKDTASSARVDRRELQKMLGVLSAGDVVVVTRIDRLARSTFDLLAIVKRISDAGAQLRSLAEPWADTGTSTGRLMLAVLGGLADVERDLIKTRTAEGRARAKARGQSIGRPFKMTPAQRAEALARKQAACRHRPQLQCLTRHDREVEAMIAVTLTRIDPAQNMSRFYKIDMQPTLFGEWAVIRELGRIGRGGTVRSKAPDGR